MIGRAFQRDAIGRAKPLKDRDTRLGLRIRRLRLTAPRSIST
jgi:hypothetical protein